MHPRKQDVASAAVDAVDHDVRYIQIVEALEMRQLRAELVLHAGRSSKHSTKPTKMEIVENTEVSPLPNSPRIPDITNYTLHWSSQTLPPQRFL